ncbi:hypothetical protein [Cereibacter sphaeroides]|uniref:hypothetical protein n=1 Tax=Cereibacter sphaeroides TaxID=1063 RepID=UPI001F387A83|nr:hypothetical protein [Cereibacter sphaeroides]MCE6970571.1 hypothetical protein [Cereibacter sphaeroides]
MKGSNSRFSHRASQRYSNLAQVQGGMVTDADLTEAGQLHQARDEVLGGLAFRSGVPARDGMVGFDGAGLPFLQEGQVVARGKPGRFTLTGSPSGTAARFAAQADLPDGPALGNGRVLLYADLWERPVFAIEDGYLADPGLHGAETSYRTRTMVQVKALPVGDAAATAAALAALEAGVFPFLRRGTALASVAPKQTEIAIDRCDPCADRIDIGQTLPNALFRIEAIAVARDGAGAVSAVTLAWSLENGEALELAANLSDATTREAFARPPAVYEFCSQATEAQVGSFPAGIAARRPTLSETLFPVPAGTPPFTFVRRWDGAATASLGGAVTEELGTGTLTVSGQTVGLAHEFFSLTLDLAGREVQPGDYWLVELRRHAAEADRLRLVGADAAGKAPPAGIEHHYCPLFVTTGDTAEAPDDATRRGLSMPALSDLPATHVGFVPACPDWYGEVETVQQALDALCNLPADKVSFTPDPGCERFEGTTTVAEALERLCTVEDNLGLGLMLRTMMDWGVVCGLRLSISSAERGEIQLSDGVALDAAGRLVQVKGRKLDLREVKGAEDVPEIQRKFGEVCLALSIGRNDGVTLHLIDPDRAKGAADPTMAEAIRDCQTGKKGGLLGGKALKALTRPEREVLRKVNMVWSERKALDGKLGLSVAEAQTLDRVSEALLADYAEVISAEEADEIREVWKLADTEFDPGRRAGGAADVRRMQRAVARIATLGEFERRFLEDCECRHALTPCPPDAPEPAYVPLGCIVFADPEPGVLRIGRICHFCCRRQAMSWRAWRYHRGSFTEDLFTKLEKVCCVAEVKPKPGGFDDDLDTWPPGRRPDFPDLEPEVDLLWPPKIGPDDLLPGGGFTDPVPDDIRVRPDILKLGLKDAVDVLTGNGLEIAEVIDLDRDPAGFGKVFELAEAAGTSVRLDAVPKAGDRVAVLVRGGEALGFATIGAGSGRFRFRTRSEDEAVQAEIAKAVEAATKTPTTVDTSVIEAKLRDLAIDRDRLNQDLVGLQSSRAALAEGLAALGPQRAAAEAELAGLRAGLAEFEPQRAAAEAGLAGLKAGLAELDPQRAAAEAGLAVVRTGLAELEPQRTAIESALASARTELAAIETQRRAAEAGLETVKADLATLETRRQAAEQGLATARTELSALEAQRADTMRGIDEGKAALADLRTAQEKLLLDLRGAQPVDSLNLDPEAVTRLRSNGILTVRDLDAASAPQLRRMLSGTAADPAALKSAASAFLRR